MNLLKRSGSRSEGIVAFPGGAHVLRSGQLFLRFGMRSSTEVPRPAAPRMVCMDLTGACHQRRCIFRSSRSTTAGLSLLRARSDARMSKRVQRFGCGCPTLASLYARHARGCVWGPRLPDAGLVQLSPVSMGFSAAPAGASGSILASSSPAPRSLPPSN